MAESKLKNIDISELTPDDRNLNLGSEFGGGLISKSLQEFGGGRSILIDKNNNIIAGNKTVENAGSIGMNKIVVVETNGDCIVAVKRTDIDLHSARGREMALADNKTGQENLKWDFEEVEKLTEEFEIDAKKWGFEDFNPELLLEEEDNVAITTIIEVEGTDFTTMSALYEELQDRGLKVKMK